MANLARSSYVPESAPPRLQRGPRIPRIPFVFQVVATYSEPPPIPDLTAPTVGNFGTASGTPNTPQARLQFDVTDNAALRKVMVLVHYGAYDRTEAAYDGDNFVGAYAGTTQVISGGLRFTLWHRSGWPTSPTIRVIAFDTAANEAT